jgi:hypothetical protein
VSDLLVAKLRKTQKGKVNSNPAKVREPFGELMLAPISLAEDHFRRLPVARALHQFMCDGEDRARDPATRAAIDMRFPFG